MFENYEYNLSKQQLTLLFKPFDEEFNKNGWSEKAMELYREAHEVATESGYKLVK
jgi:hypothetical protein